MKMLISLALLMPWTVFACLELGDETPRDHATRTGGDNRAAQDLRNSMAVSPRELTAQAKFGEARTEAQKRQAEAVNKIYAGDLEGAIALLKGIEDRSPGQHSTAVNLGTAYELKGDNVNALKWITAGIERNSGSHHGTEWLHILILKAKIEAAKHPDRPLVSHIVWVPEGMASGSMILVHGENHSAEYIRSALAYQLSERLVFMKPKDPYVADLLYSYALIEANLSAVENGLGLLQLAREYGFPDEDLLKRQEQRFQSVVQHQRVKSLALVLLGVVTLMLLTDYCRRRKEFFIRCLVHFKARRAALTAAARTAD